MLKNVARNSSGITAQGSSTKSSAEAERTGEYTAAEVLSLADLVVALNAQHEAEEAHWRKVSKNLNAIETNYRTHVRALDEAHTKVKQHEARLERLIRRLEAQTEARGGSGERILDALLGGLGTVAILGAGYLAYLLLPGIVAWAQGLF